MEEIERPSFENFLSKPTTLSDHLAWQLGALSVTPEVREAAEIIIGNLSEDGYLIASDEELLGIAPPAPPEVDATVAANVVKEAAALGLATDEDLEDDTAEDKVTPSDDVNAESEWVQEVNSSYSDSVGAAVAVSPEIVGAEISPIPAPAPAPAVAHAEIAPPSPAAPGSDTASSAASSPAAARKSSQPAYQPNFVLKDLHEALDLVRQMDPPGVACRDLRDCLLYQLRYHQQQLATHKNGNGEAIGQILSTAVAIVDQHLRALQNKQYKEIARAINRPPEAVQEALEYIRTLDPRPGLRYNKSQPRLIEPDVAFIKHGDEWLVMMNEDDVPVLRLNPAYKKLLTRDTNDKDTRNYVKERYKSAIQLIKNIEQRKQTITKVCYSIVTRQQDFLEKGIDQLKPMMIKEVAEEIGVHPSTVSRAVANKYAHTPQGVFELRYFFSESVNGPQGGNTSLLILKRRVKKLIEEEDPNRPLTDEQITRILQSQGIQVTRRTVAKYREDMRIPSTHQRRVKK